MKIGIQWKIIGIYLSVVLVIMIASGSVIIFQIEEQYFNKVKIKTEGIADSVKELLDFEGNIDLEKDRDLLIAKLRNLATIGEDTDIYILNDEGFVEIALGTEFKRGDYVPGTHKNGFAGVVNETLSTNKMATSNWVYLANGGHDSQSTLEHALPIIEYETDKVKAIIYVISDTKEIYSNVDTVMNTLGMGTLVALALAGAFSAIFARMITQPIKALTRSAKLLQEGAFKKIPNDSNDEIGQLTVSFNQMAQELRRTLLDISSEKNKLERILENLADGVLAFNRQGVLIHANSVSYDMLEKSKIDHRFDYIFPKFGLDVSFDNILEDDEKYKNGIMMNVGDKYISFHFASYESSHGEKEGLTVVMQDVTSQQKLDQMRKDFVANVSHELRTPLTTVKTYTETLINGAIDERETALDFLSVMEKETDRMTTLVHDLLELSKIDNKQMQLNMQVVDIYPLLIDTIRAQAIQAEGKHHKVKLSYNKNKEYLIEGDPARIGQVFHNILSNAIKYTEDNGEIKIELLSNNKQVIIKVQDTGIGMSKNDLQRIFERFYRADKARSRKMGGTGLGLSIAKEMVELHGGTINIESEPGKGTIVTIIFNALNLDYDF
ncbi:hypothetical protein AN643_00990 [Candidatus Epulonipiscioides saccharophilum]|nr:hypothetical protein AN643_00990 [Epulopiscium sp. SCG-B10WGA-EpuloB]